MNKRTQIEPSLVRNLPDSREVWLLGQPPVQTFLEFHKESVVGGNACPPSELVDEWRLANDYYGELETSEAGLVETTESRPLDRQLMPLAKETAADPRFKRAHDSLPWRFAMVELEKLIIAHPYLSESHKETIQTRIGPSPAPEALFRFCQPLKRDEAQVQARALGSKRYMFWSPSTDFRFQECSLISPSLAPGHQTIGTIGGLLALSVGYGSNFLSLIQYGNRYVIHNGHHRAYALLSLGITHAPCVVQTVTRADELRLVAGRAVSDDPAFYFVAKRPPLLKDFLDPRIRRVFNVHRAVNVIEISIEVKESKQVRDFADA